MALDPRQMGVRELDLSDCHVNSLSDKINAVPGLRTSTGEFFIFISNMSTYSSPPWVTTTSRPRRLNMDDKPIDETYPLERHPDTMEPDIPHIFGHVALLSSPSWLCRHPLLIGHPVSYFLLRGGILPFYYYPSIA